jgi:hypothetical protein
MVIEECSWDLERELGIEEDRAALPASILLPDLSIAVGHTIGKEVYTHISFRYETASDIFYENACELWSDCVAGDVDQARAGKLAGKLDGCWALTKGCGVEHER